MKKPTWKSRKWLQHRRRAAARQRARNARRVRLVGLIRPTDHWSARPAAKNMPMPTVMCFEQNCPETAAGLHKIRERLLTPMRGVRHGRKVSKHRAARIPQATPYFRFEDIQEITLSAAIVLAAEFQRASILANKAPPTVVNVEAWKPEVLSTLWELGFFDVVGFPTGVGKPDLTLDAALLPMTSGDTADSQAVSRLIDDLQALYPGGGGGAPTGLIHLYGAMIEAVVNVTRHAYPSGLRFRHKHVRRWWMGGAVDRAAGWTTAVLYDQGVTIPQSLPRWDQYAGWSRRCAAALGLVPPPSDVRSDGAAIAIAVEESVSSTGDPHRGHGLAQMRNFVNECREGYLRIMSRCGEVVFRPGRSPDIRSHDVSIGGTLIEWNVLV